VTIVDTTVWSLALRRSRRARTPDEQRHVFEWRELVVRGEATLIGPIRQEVLMGIRDPEAFERIRRHLAGFDDLALQREDHELAARYGNTCLAHGIAGSAIDLMICAAASRRDFEIFTTDSDFPRYARVLPIRLRPL